MQNDATPHTADSEQGQAAAFYVATDGNDAWSGKLAAPNAGKTDGPFATLQRARDAVRELKAAQEGLTEPVTIMVRGGKYYPESTLELTEADSGAETAPVTYSAYPGETPVFSGGRRITGWKPYKDAIYMCEIPETNGGNLFFRQLFADGQRQVRARYPNLDPDAEKWNGRWALSKPDDAANESIEPYIVWDEPDAFQRAWAKPTQGEVFLLPRKVMWGDSSLIRIKAINREKKVMKLVHGMRSFDLNPIYFPRKKHRPDNCQFIVENILEELDQPGEWCLDTEDGILYFWPPVLSQGEGPKESIDGMEIVVPVVKCLVHLEGASNVRISGFVFTETKGGEPSSHYHDVDGVGAMAPQMAWEYCGETIYMNRCENCSIEHNRIFNIGGNGVYLRHHNQRNSIRRNEISYAGANGVVLAGGKDSIYTCTGGTLGTPHPVFNNVTDNTIHHIGLVDTYAAGVFLGLGNWNRIAHNDIHDVPHHAINLGNSRYGRNYIEYNKIRRPCVVTNDTAAINCWHEMPPEIEPPGHVIRYNSIADADGRDDSVKHGLAMGIYLDNWSSNCIVAGNIIINRGIGILVKGHNNIVENNIVVNSGDHHFWACDHCCYDEYAVVVSKNIFYDDLDTSSPFFKLAERDHLCKVLLQCDNNLFFKKGDDDPLIAKDVRFSEWPPVGGGDEDAYDANSIAADPLFVDADNGDYRLKPDSPALKLGFQPIDISRIGVRSKGPEESPNKLLQATS